MKTTYPVPGKIVQLMTRHNYLYALDDQGYIWLSMSTSDERWVRIRSPQDQWLAEGMEE